MRSEPELNGPLYVTRVGRDLGNFRAEGRQGVTNAGEMNIFELFDRRVSRTLSLPVPTGHTSFSCVPNSLPLNQSSVLSLARSPLQRALFLTKQ